MAEKYTYTFKPLKVREGRPAFLRLTKLVAAAAEGLDEQANLDITGLLKALGRAVERLEDADLEFFCDLLSKNCDVEGGDYGHKIPLAPVFDTHFQDSYDELVMWLYQGIRANFEKSFLGLAERLGASPAAIASGLTSPKAPTGTSGES